MKLYYGFTFEQYQEEFHETFNRYFEFLVQDEGGYLPGKQARKLKDPGGATKFGISLRFLISLGIDQGDLAADGDINNDGVIDEKDIVCLTKEQAKILYFKYFFNPLYDMLDSREIANRLFNFGVNAGKPRAVMILQQTVNQMMDAKILKVDGIFGKKTIAAVNGLDPKKFYDKYIINIEDFYRGLKKEQFLQGWLNRLRRIFKWSKDS